MYNESLKWAAQVCMNLDPAVFTVGACRMISETRLVNAQVKNVQKFKSGTMISGKDT